MKRRRKKVGARLMGWVASSVKAARAEVVEVVERRKIDATLATDGTSIWSNREAAKVRCYRLDLVRYEVDRYGELRVFFTKRTWDVEKHGLIYTDRGFERELRKYLAGIGLPARRVAYSEQGMQGTTTCRSTSGRASSKVSDRNSLVDP